MFAVLAVQRVVGEHVQREAAGQREHDPTGRIRADSSRPPAASADPSDPDAPSLHFDLFASDDQLRKGAALNAIQIAELILQKADTPVGAGGL